MMLRPYHIHALKKATLPCSQVTARGFVHSRVRADVTFDDGDGGFYKRGGYH